MELRLIVAVAENGVIGSGRSVPWDHPEDVRHYKETVAGHPVIVGRRTFESMRKLDVPLHVVLTSDGSRRSADDDVAYVTTLEVAVDAAAETGDDVAYVIGGGEIYRAFLPYTRVAVVSEINRSHEGDVTFPDLGPEWVERDRDPRGPFDVVWYENTDPEPIGGGAGATGT